MSFKSQPHVPAELRESFDSRDPFITGGHQILKPQSRERTVPPWTKDDASVRRVLLQSFPKLATSTRQRGKAARWNRIIHLYFRMQLTEGEIAEEFSDPMNPAATVTPKQINHMILSIRRAAARWLSGVSPKKRGGKRPGAGRPKIQIKSFCPRIKRLPREKFKKRCFKPLIRRSK
jgi:hypothetical protein